MTDDFSYKKEDIRPLGTIIYPIKLEEKSKTIKCKICNGTGKLSVTRNKKKYTFPCPCCLGEGKDEKYYNEWVIPKLVDYRIGGYHISAIADSALGEAHNFELLDIKYSTVHGYVYYNHSDCFLTKEKAEAECKYRNRFPSRKRRD